MTPFHGLIGHSASWLVDKNGVRVKNRPAILSDALVGHCGYQEALWCRFCGGWVKAIGMGERTRHLHGRCRP